MRYRLIESVTPGLQRVLDALQSSPAIIKTATWDVGIWNRAAAAGLTDYSKLERDQRNIPRLMFGCNRIRVAAADDWESIASFVVGAFRADATRAGASAEITDFVEELSWISPTFSRLWRANDVVAHGDGIKRIWYPELGPLELEFSTFAVDGPPELGMIVYNPVTFESSDGIRSLITS